MRIFFDTEFTDLKKDAELISAGFITEKGDSLYFERTDFDRSKSNEFVKETVYPLLDAPVEFKWTANECCARLVDWILDQSDAPILISDSHWDADILREIYGIHGGIREFIPKLKYELLHFPFGGWAASYQIGYNEHFLRNPGKEHHALHDAKALRQGWLRMNGYYY